MELNEALTVEPSSPAGSVEDGCPRCGEPWERLTPVTAATLGGANLRRCTRCGTRATTGKIPPKLLFTCEGCGLPFLDERILPHGSQRCATCEAGRLPVNVPEADVARATEAEIRPALESAWRFASSPDLGAYLNRLVRDLAARMNGAPADCRVALIDDPALRTLALPTGTILVSVGMLRFLQDEAELVFVLGHELGHVASGEAANRLVRSGFRGLARGKEDRAWADAVLDVVRLGYGRRQERDADARALDAMTALRYDSESALRLLRRLHERVTDGDPHVAELSVAHPPPAYRIRKLERLLYGRVGRERLLRVNRELFRRIVEPGTRPNALMPTDFSGADAASATVGWRRRRALFRVVGTVVGVIALAAALLLLGILLRG